MLRSGDFGDSTEPPFAQILDHSLNLLLNLRCVHDPRHS